MDYDYEIIPLPGGNGWRLSLLAASKECTFQEFSLPYESMDAATDWWNSLTDKQRHLWMVKAASVVPADARRAYRLADAYDEARAVGDLWIAFAKSKET